VSVREGSGNLMGCKCNRAERYVFVCGCDCNVCVRVSRTVCAVSFCVPDIANIVCLGVDVCVCVCMYVCECL